MHGVRPKSDRNEMKVIEATRHVDRSCSSMILSTPAVSTRNGRRSFQYFLLMVNTLTQILWWSCARRLITGTVALLCHLYLPYYYLSKQDKRKLCVICSILYRTYICELAFFVTSVRMSVHKEFSGILCCLRRDGRYIFNREGSSIPKGPRSVS